MVTVDVNLFPTTSHLLDPILMHRDMVAWVPQYEDTASISTGRGETFNQNLIALRAQDWLQITGYSGSLTRLKKKSVYVREVCKKSKWKFKMAFAMKGGGSRLPLSYFEK